MAIRLTSPAPVSTARALVRSAGHWLALVAAFVASAASAATNVSGTLASNTTWSVAQSPYLVQSDLTVDNGAVLTIDAGVTVRVASGASLTVKNGTLKAIGTNDSPILFTSSNAAPAPGDWGQLRFLDGASDATRLNEVTVQYGSGVAIENASPTLTNLAIRNNRGAAITSDLGSSPTGSGLSASGNDINGIAVPAGTIAGSVQWGLVGIPYVLSLGAIQVGQAPIAFDPATLTMNPGVTGTLRVSVATAAPAAGWTIPLASSALTVATVPASVTIPAGSTWADVTVTARTAGQAAITADSTDFGTATAGVTVAALPALQLLPATATIGKTTQSMSVKLPQAAAASQLVRIGNSDATKVSAPGSVTVPAGSQTAIFNATGLAEGSALLSAHATDYASATAAITVNTHALQLPSTVLVQATKSVPVTITLTEPAPAGGLTINLSSSKPSIATVPASVSVAAGATSSTFNVQGVANGTAVVTASATNYFSATTNVTVDSITVYLAPGSNAYTVPRGFTTAPRTILLSKAAPTGGLTIDLTTSAPGIATVEPSQIVIPAGQTTSATPVVVQGVAKGGTTLTLAATGATGLSVAVTVTDPPSLQVSSSISGGPYIGKGLVTYSGEIQVVRLVNGTAFATDTPETTITLTSTDPTKLQIPATVTIPARTGGVSIPVSGMGLGSAAITAAAEGYTSSAPLTLQVVTPKLDLRGSLDAIRTPTSQPDDLYIQLITPTPTGGIASNRQNASSKVLVNLSVASPDGIAPGVYNAAGELKDVIEIAAGTNTTYPATPYYVGVPTGTGSYTLTASADQMTSVSFTTKVEGAVVRARTRQSSGPKAGRAVVGKGMITASPVDGSEVWIERVTTGGAAISTGGAVVVNLTFNGPSNTCSIPATVTIPDKVATAVFAITGLNEGTTSIHAEAAGYTSGDDLPVDTVQPQVVFHAQPTKPVLAGSTSTLGLHFLVPGAALDSFQLPAAPVTVTLQSTNPAVGSVTSPIVVPANRSSWVGSTFNAIAAGSTSITADADGFSQGTSSTITVVADPYFDSVSLLLPFDGANGAKATTDLSNTPKTLTFYGGAKLSTAQAKFGESSLAMPGSGTGSYLTVPSGQDFGSDFTVEAWIYVNSVATAFTIFDSRAAGYKNGLIFMVGSNGALSTEYRTSTGTAVSSPSSAPGAVTFGAWHHVALVRQGNTHTVYVDGQPGANPVTSSQGFANPTALIGWVFDFNNNWAANGYLDDLRVTKQARYKGPFTPPTRSIYDQTFVPAP